MTVAQSVGLAVAVWAAAELGVTVGGGASTLVLATLGLLALNALVGGRVGPFMAALVAVAFVSGLRAEAAVEPVGASAVEQVTAAVASDPVQVGRGVRVDVTIDGQRLEGWAFSSAAGPLHQALRGDRIVLSGTVVPRPADRPWLAARGVVGRLQIEAVHDHVPARGAAGVANGLRVLVERGAASLGAADRALFTGFVFGDDRRQHEADRELFRDAGLGHLLAVSGQNVAFVLALVTPLVGRLVFPLRVPLMLGALVFFAMITRFEPSVLRATAMAGGAAVAAAVGREADSRRLLAYAVVGLAIFDPMLLQRLAFRLSVAASAGILWFTEPIAARLAGPRWLATGVAVTIAAQVAVTPLLLVSFGEVPLAALPANIVGAPVSGPIMLWGMTAGVVAGIVGGTAATVLHLPTRLGIWWIRRSAEVSTGLGLPALTVRPVLGCLIAGVFVWLRSRHRSKAG